MNTDVYRVRRRQLTDGLAREGILDPAVLAAVDAVPRHRFVPERLVDEAYRDLALPIGDGQTISQPFVVAFMTAALGVAAGSRVLEVGTGSGYQAAVLAELGCEVWSLEVLPERAAQARVNLTGARYADRVHLREGDGSVGWPEAAPFDAVIVTAGASAVPAALLEQVRTGGRLIMPVGPIEDQHLTRYLRSGEGFDVERLLAVRFVPLVHA